MIPRPRGRPKMSPDKAQMRSDAIHAMRNYGFPEELIDSTINELLDAYGLEGWQLIQEDSYEVLLDKILENVEKETNGKDDPLQIDGRDENKTKESAAGPSSSAVVPICSNEEAKAIQLEVSVSLDTESETNNVLIFALKTDGFECNDSLPIAEGEGSRWKDINVDQGKKKQLSNAMDTDDQKFQAVKRVGSSSHSSQYDICAPQGVDSLLTQRRRPYHGWISDDEEVIVRLAPPALPEQLALLFATDASKTRKRRWDVRPEDM